MAHSLQRAVGAHGSPQRGPTVIPAGEQPTNGAHELPFVNTNGAHAITGRGGPIREHEQQFVNTNGDQQETTGILVGGANSEHEHCYSDS